VSSDPIIGVAPLAFPWQTKDPFLVCVHHVDQYPRGNDRLGPAASLEGRDIGQDFAGKDGWRMYHGDVVPGFPQHPHRGFETVTFVREGFIDHSDSLGATARFGRGDVQWLTAGAGIVHSEMFPLLKPDASNRLELFQIWVNLPSKSKFAAPYFPMFWDHDVPRVRPAAGVEITLVAGALDGAQAPAPPPDSWAANPVAELAIWLITLEPGAKWALPAAKGARTARTLYFFAGAKLEIEGRVSSKSAAIEVAADRPVTLAAPMARSSAADAGRPIGEPVAQYGPFVMNTRAELDGVLRLPAHAVRRLAVQGQRPGAPARAQPVRAHADGRVEDAPA
jgi:redox-sensitive bicupin YhaK (pirin superfamily)